MAPAPRSLSMVRMACLALTVALGGSTAAVGSEPDPAPSLSLETGDHIAIIGNTLAERMQHHGWLETLIHARFPEHELVVRNLAFPGDELTLRLRSADFGTPDEWLTRCQADVVLAFFGYNESFGGEEGLEAFKDDLAEFLTHTLDQRYNGETAPRLVLFSPIAHENRNDRNLPDGRENNARLALYTEAMAEVAREHGVVFVDLFGPSRALYDTSDQPLTINGIHFTEYGDQQLAPVILKALFGERPDIERDAEALETLRQAVLDKNFHWFHRYRTTDGYSIYGGRADLEFVDGQTNREVMQREMEVLDAMTANRDRRIWAVVQGGDLEVDDSNTPPFIPVVTNKPGEGPDGEHLFLGGEEAIAHMEVADGMQVNLFASEEMFPELVNPVQMAFDTQGRLWVAAWPTYPHWKPKEPMNDKLLILEDTTGDGRADVCKVFADDLHNPTGFEFHDGGVIVAMAPDILFLKDTTSDDRADVRVRILNGIDSADTHHTANSFVFDPGGALYFQEGTFHHTQVETPYGPPVRLANAGVFRYEPLTHKFEVYVAHNFANPHGHVFDRWGQDIVHDGTGSQPYHGTLFSGFVAFPRKHPSPPQVYQQRTRPCPATEILSSRHFPDALQGNLLVGNVIGFQGILQYRIEDDGSSFSGTEVEPIVSSRDPNFRPADIEIGPDGAIYFTDWHNPIIGHMQHNLRDPSRNRTHGRVYRVTYSSRPLLEPIPIAGESIENLLERLKEPENRVRYRAKIELSSRDSDQVIAAVRRWKDQLDPNDPEYEHQMMEALWLHQYHNVVDLALLERMLGSSEYRARAAATRVLWAWRDRVPDALGRLKSLAADPHPRVRLEAVRAASFFTEPDAFEVVVIAEQHPTDRYLDYTRLETMKTLEPHWTQALAEGRAIATRTEAGRRFLLRTMSVEHLLARERDAAVYQELLRRPGVLDEVRQEALAALARMANTSELRVLLDAIQTIDGAEDDQRDVSVAFDLVRLLTGYDAEALANVRGEIEHLATSARQAVIRQVGCVALITIDGSGDRAWALGSQSIGALRDLLGAVPLVSDASVRASLYPKIEPLLHELPAELVPESGASKGTYGRYVRVELPRRGTLTLAEVEVYSGGENVARRGQASQINTAHGGRARRAIDGNTSGFFADGGQTHTRENTDNPWWELDLGDEYPIESIVIYNRIEGIYGHRLHGFTLRVLDSQRHEVFRQDGLPAPEEKAAFAMDGGGPASLIRRAAMEALTSIRGHETETFHTLAEFVRDGVDRLAAVRAIQRIPRASWPTDQAEPLLAVLIPHIRQIPTETRTSPAALDLLEFAEALASLLPAERARDVRATLRELGVRVIRLGTLPERMAYDQEVIVVEAGKPVEILFENPDLMPHNLVITQPGALEEVGLLAEATAQQPGAIERQYVPESDQILLASRMLQARQSQRLSFTAPTEPGVYPYVCTYPGHWRRMFGAMYVVENLDEYLASPDAYLAANPLPVEDDLLKDRRPRTEWTFEDLIASIEPMSNDRSFGNGQQMFRVANCIACHQMNGEGQPIGPDLTQLEDDHGPVEILQEILDPSAEIDEEYQTYVFDLETGQIVSGLILDETDDTVLVIENPLVSTEPTVLNKSEIVERQKTPTSIMPKGLLDTLTREEILDLIAYVTARGDRNHELFQGQGRHNHHHVGGHEHEHGSEH